MIKILDTTYREGKQSYLGHLLPNSIHKHAKLLDQIGIEYLQIGHPLSTLKNLIETRKLIKKKSNIQLSAHGSIEDLNNIESIVSENIKNIDISIRANDKNVSNKIKLLKTIIKSYRNNKCFQLQFRVGLEFACKTSERQLVLISKELIAIGREIIRITISDTDGSVLPKDIKKIFKTLDSVLPKHVALGVHLHNDIGLACANAAVIIEFFKNRPREVVVETSIGGIGERNGILSLGDIFALGCIKRFSFITKKYRPSFYKELYYHTLNNHTFNRDPLNHFSFAHSSGIHIQRFLESGTYQSINPNMVGEFPQLIINESIGSGAIRLLLQRYLSLDISTKQASAIASEIRNICADKKICMNEKEVVSFLRKKLNRN